MEKKKVPLSADEIIAGLGKRKLKEDIKDMIRVLSDEALNSTGLTEHFLRKESASDCREADNQEIKRLVRPLRSWKILGWQDGEYFIKGSKADPQFQANNFKPPAHLKKPEERRSLRSIIYEILKQAGPMTAGRLASRANSHPDCGGSYGQDKDLKKRADKILNSGRNKCFFERDASRRKYADWRVKDGSSPPPWKSKQGPPDYKKSAIYQLMRTKAVIRGWSYRELFEELDRLKSGYISLAAAQANLSCIFYQNKAGRFEKIPGTKPVHWRARWLGPLKTPSCPKEFFDLASQVLDDLMAPRSLEDLLKVIRQSGHLFGYQTNELPLTFLQNGVVGAVAGTKYAGLIS